MARSAFISGAARGLGKEIAQAMGAAGYSLYLIDILPERLDETRAELTALGYHVATRVTDVAQRQECLAAVADCADRLGNLTVLVNCAAVTGMSHFTDVSQEAWDRTLAVNLSGPFHLTQAALPHIITAHGSIINIASSNGLLGTPYTGPYSATKAALISLTKTLAMEYMDHPIRVNAVCPGPMATEIGNDLAPSPTIKREKIVRYSGQRGLGNPADVAKVVAFLASEEARSIHGAIWTADQGLTAG